MYIWFNIFKKYKSEQGSLIPNMELISFDSPHLHSLVLELVEYFGSLISLLENVG